MSLFHPTYFAPICHYVAISKSREIIFEVEDNFQKQTYRNRCFIYTADGKHLLNVPIQHTKGVKQKTKDVKIDYKDDWNKLHLKTLQTAYNSSPFFEFYIDELRPILEKKHTFLLDLNFEVHQFIMDSLQLEIPTSKTLEFHKDPASIDYRNLAISKKEPTYQFDYYYQVFNSNNGFLPNLSILDLLFMEGPNALNYLESQSLNL